MAWIKFAVLVLSVLSLSSGFLLRDDAHRKNQHDTQVFLNMLEEAVINEIRNYTKTGYRSPMFDSWLKMTPIDKQMAILEVEDYSPEQAVIGCLACRTYLAVLMRDRQNGASEQDLANSATNICGLITDFSPAVCRGVIEKNVESMIYIIDSRPNLSATQICGFILQGECNSNPDAVFQFTVNVNPGPAITAPKSVTVPRNANELRIVHITDIHYDPNYMVGGWAQCPNPICCRRNDGTATNPAHAAGRWGDYRDCGNPWEVVEDTIREIRRANPQIDMVYHTGDMVDHGIWETTEAGNRAIMDRIYNLMREVFGNIPVYSSLGNHEAQPTNIFAPSSITRPSLSTSWLYNYAADIWQRHGWLPAAALPTVRAGGYYTLVVQPGLRLISLNNNDCYTFNWWIMYSRVEIQAAMQWLHNTLLAAEQAGERVHILKHIPTNGGSCFKWWSQQYRRVVDRFHGIIGAQFNGHSHRDEFQVQYDSATSTHAINAAWNGGGGTPFSFLNPNYIMYYVDRTHFQVQDYDSYIFSVSEANQNQATPPRWYKQYSFREAFGLTDTSPAALDRFVFDMARNRNTIRQYWRYKVKDADPLIARGCDDNCLRNEVCAIVTNEFNEPRRCNQVLAVFGQVA